MTVALTLPSWCGMAGGTFALRSFRTSSVSTFQPSVPRREGARDTLWSCRFEMPPLDRATAIEAEAWFAQIAHEDYCFLAYDPLRRFPLGVGGGFYETGNTEILFTKSGGGTASFCTDLSLVTGAATALVRDEAARGATSVVVTGLDTGLDGETIVRRGDHVGIGLPGEMNLHMAIGNAVCDSSGDTRINFIAPLWKRAMPGDIVRFVKPTARFVMVDESTGELVRSLGPIANGTAVGIEMPYQEAA